MSTIIIPGAQKSGTTALFERVISHESVIHPKKKETHFFSQDEKVISNHRTWYNNEVKMNDKRHSIDASTSYLRDKHAAKKVKEHLPDPKVLIVLRDPVQRAYSGYLQMRKKVPTVEGRKFSDIINTIYNRVNRSSEVDAKSITKFEKEIIKESKKVDKNYITNNYTDAPFDYNFEDMCWPYTYLRNSMYHNDIMKYKKVLDKEKVMILFFEHLVAKPEKYLSRVFRFLELDQNDKKLILPKKNKTKLPSGKLSRWILNIKDIIKPGISFLDSLLPLTIYEKLRKSRTLFISDKPKLRNDIGSKTRTLLSGEYSKMSTHYDTVESIWRY